jgi:zinc transport system substrate-binding protein
MSLGTSQTANRIRGGKADSVALAAGLAAVVLTAAVFLLIAPTAGQTAPGETAADALETFAGIPPVAYLVKRIGGPHVRVEVLVQPGQDPHIFEPTPRQVVRLSKARLFFKIGIPFEDRLTERISTDNAKIAMVDVAHGIVRRMTVDADHDEAGADPHVWLAPRLLKQMAANITSALSAADPAHEHDFCANQAALNAELDALDRRLATSVAPYHGEAFYVFHPAFGYFADAYGLRQESVEIEGKPPTPRQLVKLIEQARADHVKIIFLQPRFNQQAAESIAQSLGGAVMPMDDVAYDVIVNLNDVAEKLAAASRERGARNRSADGALREAVSPLIDGETRLVVPCATHHSATASLHAPYALPCSVSEAAA